MRNRYRKERRLLLLLLLIFVMVFCLWLEAGKPSLFPQGRTVRPFGIRQLSDRGI